MLACSCTTAADVVAEAATAASAAVAAVSAVSTAATSVSDAGLPLHYC